jgi:hypothetical protein
MAKQKRQAKISYTYDRLCEQKLAQVYRLLVPDNTNTGFNNYSLMEILINARNCIMPNNEQNAKECDASA